MARSSRFMTEVNIKLSHYPINPVVCLTDFKTCQVSVFGLSPDKAELAAAVAHVSPAAEIALIAAGCLGNVRTALYEHRRWRLP